MDRSTMLAQARSHHGAWDMIVIGGGATGVGVALDAAARGYEVLLLEQHDFGKGTSSRSTKLVHGGVRYLEQGNLSLVMEALRERGILRRNAPHLVTELPFVVPTYSWWDGPFYGLGLKLYQVLSGRYGFGPSQLLNRDETRQRLSNIRSDGLTGGVVYYDGQFDDSRLLLSLVATAAEQGATLCNYVRVARLTRDSAGYVRGVVAEDAETGETFEATAKVVINATGPFTDAVRRLAEPTSEPMIRPSQGIHLVFDGSFLPGDHAILVPHSSDGRVMFAIPWHGHTLVGTTDTPIDEATLEPRPLAEEIDFVLNTAAQYLERKPTRADIRSAFAGIRPLVGSGQGANTAALSRDHTVHIDQHGLVTVTGGKWTTYRNMAEDCVTQAALLADLPDRPCPTKDLNLHGFRADADGPLAVYGTDARLIRELAAQRPELAEPLDAELDSIGAQVVFAVRCEMARTVEDVLARRTRALLLNADAAVRMAPRVAELMAAELGRDAAWTEAQIGEFEALADGYLVR